MMFAELNRVLSRVTPRFFALWEGDTVELSTMREVLEQAGLPHEEAQLRLAKVELEVVGQHPS